LTRIHRICTINTENKQYFPVVLGSIAMSAQKCMMVVAGIAAVCILSIAADQKATTPDGKQVILRDDGTWRYVKQSDVLAEKLAKSAAEAPAQPGAQAQDLKNPATYDLTGGTMYTKKKEGADEPERTALVEVIKSDRAFDVRKARWGMTREEVKKSEDLQLLSQGNDLLEYKFVLLGIKSKIRYRFVNSRLASAEYVIEQDDVNPSRFYDDFQELKKYLRGLYGMPVADEKTWLNDIYKGDEKNWGFAISLGFLSCKTSWQNATTKISLNQTGGNHLIKTNIEYGARSGAR
jgi:hypothetical protein